MKVLYTFWAGKSIEAIVKKAGIERSTKTLFMVEFSAMFLYLPYSTDAPIYYRPIVTIAMIVINVLVFFMFTQEEIEPFMLAIGAGLHPGQWLTANFLHADIFHLTFNMFFLWVFGLIIEGKLGYLKMLVVYLGIGINFGATIQILMQGHEPSYGLGASAIIFGLAAMSLVWAPEYSGFRRIKWRLIFGTTGNLLFQ